MTDKGMVFAWCCRPSGLVNKWSLVKFEFNWRCHGGHASSGRHRVTDINRLTGVVRFGSN
jgi:hypothetical protein